MADIIEDVIIPALKADSEVNGIINGRVYWVKPPGETYTYPFLTVIEASDTEGEVADDEELEAQIAYSVEIFSKGNFRTLQKAVQRVMKSLDYTRDAGQDEWIPELKCYHKAINFM